MATDNKGVMVYLPLDLEEVLEKYCTENKITRKNKDGEPVPSMGTGIVHYLRSHLLGEVPSTKPNGFSIDDVRSLIDQAIDPLTSDLVNLQTKSIDRDNLDDLTADVADLREQLTQLTTTRALTMDDVMVQCSSRVEIQVVIDRCCEKLQAQLNEVKQDCDFTTEGVMRLIADALESKASIPTVSTAIAPTTAKKSHSTAIKTASAPGEVHKEVLKVANRLEREPLLKLVVTQGLAAGHTGEKLGQYLADKGFYNSHNDQYTGASNSRFKLAIEYLSGLENRDSIND
jgi:hypothetical protein